MWHHAYYIEGALGDYEPLQLAGALHQKHERFGIDEARELITLAALKNYQDNTVFLVEVSAITSEAQQALLKLFEEPQAGTTFVLVVPHGALLPTLGSRMLPYPGLTKVRPLYKKGAEFLQASPKERSTYVAELLKEEEGVKDRVREFLNELEQTLAPKIATSAQVREGLQDIAQFRSYVNDRSPSLKMLLEHLAISLPRIV